MGDGNNWKEGMLIDVAPEFFYYNKILGDLCWKVGSLGLRDKVEIDRMLNEGENLWFKSIKEKGYRVSDDDKRIMKELKLVIYDIMNNTNKCDSMALSYLIHGDH